MVILETAIGFVEEVHKYEIYNITLFVDDREIVSIYVAYYWCLMCKFDNLLALDSIIMVDIFQRKCVISM